MFDPPSDQFYFESVAGRITVRSLKDLLCGQILFGAQNTLRGLIDPIGLQPCHQVTGLHGALAPQDL